jgi:hypothetical protein
MEGQLAAIDQPFLGISLLFRMGIYGLPTKEKAVATVILPLMILQIRQR